MKFTKLIFASLALAAITASCDDSKENSMEITVGVPMMNVVTTKGADTKIVYSNYNVNINYTDQYIITILPETDFGQQKVSFVTPTLPYTFRSNSYWFNLSGAFNTNAGVQISNLGGFVTEAINRPPVLSTGSAQFNSTLAFNAHYKIGSDIFVQTFPKDAVYTGNTTGSDSNNKFTSDKTSYRVVINPSKLDATLYIYNAKFNEQMPELNIILTGLKVVPEMGTYKVKGEHITPSTFDGTEYPHFKFDSFELTPMSTDLTSVRIQFEVAGRFSGSFMGSYLIGNN